MTTEYTWRELRDHAIDVFAGDTPGAALEERILVVFRTHPQIVAVGIDQVAERYRQGKVTSPWAVLATHVEKATAPLDDVTATDERDRDKAIHRAEQWMRAAGKHHDSEAEIIDELFGETAALSIRLFDSPDLRERMLRLWREARPEGVKIAEQAEMRARAYVSANGQVMGEHAQPVTRPPWKVPVATRAAVDDDPEPAAVDPDPEPVAA